MELNGSISERFPRPVPQGTIIVEDEDHTFRIREGENGAEVPKTVYTLNKAPFERIQSVQVGSGLGASELDPDQYESRDTNDDGDPEAIAFTDPNAYPRDGEQFYVTYVAEPIVTRYAEGHQEVLDESSAKMDDVVRSRQVDNASDQDLNLLGSLFGILGLRQERSDADYRALLRSVVQSFNGRGTRPGLKYAIAIATDGDPEDVTINEDFEEVGYTVDIANTDARRLSSSVINEIIDRADPSGVSLLRPPVLLYDTTDIGFTSTISSSSSGTDGKVGSGTLGDGTL